MIGIQSWCGLKPVKYVNWNADKVGTQVLLTNWVWVPVLMAAGRVKLCLRVVLQSDNKIICISLWHAGAHYYSNTVIHIPGTRPSWKEGIVIFALFS